MGRRKKGSYFPNGSETYNPTTEEIGKRAYEKWLKRGCIDGYAQQDWLEAEAELRAEHKPRAVEFVVKPKE